LAPGRLITLEGGDGVGKSTLAKSLATELQRRGLDLLLTREPGGSEGGNQIRELLVRGATDAWSPLTETLLLVAARNDHLERLIRPKLAAGTWVLCDRFTDSTLAYQVAVKGLDANVAAELAHLIQAPKPDLTLILDAPPDLSLRRAGSASKGEGRFESLPPEFHARVRDAFLEIARADPERCHVLDASQPPESVLQGALAALRRLSSP
jgi:dTMP kinase